MFTIKSLEEIQTCLPVDKLFSKLMCIINFSFKKTFSAGYTLSIGLCDNGGTE